VRTPLLALILLVVSVALADSINPSTVVPALYFAGAPRGRGLATYTFGVFIVYLAGGLVLVLGPGPPLMAALHRAGPRFEHGVEAIAGVVALLFAIFLWRSRASSPDRQKERRFNSRASAFALGAGISAIELPTAFLYFGAVSAILGSHDPGVVQISLVVAYNAFFVLPLVAVIAFRPRIERQLAAVMNWIWRSAPRLLAGITAAIGVALLGTGAAGLISV
jgi:cytochrome c biogenesis protein CcdA